MKKMINPSGGVTLVADDRVEQYMAEGFKPFALSFVEIPKISAEEEKEAAEAVAKANIKPIKAKVNKADSVGIKPVKRTKK